MISILETIYILDGQLNIENFGKEIKFDEETGNIGENTDPKTEDNSFTPGQSSIVKSK
jgi:hypothetical protein